MALFRVVAPCRLVLSLPMFQRSFALMMETVTTTETSVNLYQHTRCYSLEDSHLHTHRHENSNPTEELLFVQAGGAHSCQWALKG
jgi:hypothetical protein